MEKKKSDSRVNIIASIQTPLGFFVLVVLIVEAILGIIASFSDVNHRTILIIGMIGLIILLVLIVAIIAVFRPEALYGVRPGQHGSINQKADNLEESKNRDIASCLLIEGSEKISTEMSNIAKRAEKYIYAIGGRSRDPVYLKSIELRIRLGDVHYIRVITGNHIRHSLCEHIQRIMDNVDLGYTVEENFGGVMVTHNTTIIALPSSTASVLNKALIIKNDQIAADYRSYVTEVLHNSEKNITYDKIKSLCKTCRTNIAQPGHCKGALTPRG